MGQRLKMGILKIQGAAKMIIENVYLPQKTKDQLVKIKRATGIQNWNVLSRWALCLSLADTTSPSIVATPNEHAIEMSWKVFGGKDHEIYLAILLERCKADGYSLDKDTVTQQLRNHLHRGISKMVTTKRLEDLLQLCKTN